MTDSAEELKAMVAEGLGAELEEVPSEPPARPSMEEWMRGIEDSVQRSRDAMAVGRERERQEQLSDMPQALCRGRVVGHARADAGPGAAAQGHGAHGLHQAGERPGRGGQGRRRGEIVSINKCFLSGNLTREPELRAMSGGTQVLSFGLAVNDRRRNASGEWEDAPNFVDCTMFGRRAEALSRYLSKGIKVSIEGKLRWHSWETNNGEKRSKLEVVVDEIEFMSRGGGGASTASRPDERPVQGGVGQSVYADDDIPF